MGRSHGTSKRTPFDRWFRYPAGFASDYVERIFDGIEVNDGTVIDPFTGSGVTGTASRARHLAFVGIEAHPLIADLARTKLQIDIEPDALNEVARTVGKHALLSVENATAEAVLKSSQAETSLVERSFDANVLYELISLRDEVKKRAGTAEEPYMKWALLATLRDVAAVKVGWPYQRPAIARRPRSSNATARFLARVEEIATDISTVQGVSSDATVLCGDSSVKETWDGWDGLADASVSSPPYLNNFDYADATRLEMYFWGLASTWKELCDEARSDMIVATTQQSTKPRMTAAIDSLSDLGTAGAEVKEITGALAERRTEKGTGGKQYNQVVPVYFTQMQSVLALMADKLATGARCAWLIGDSAPYGVYIDTPRLIGEIAETVGYEVRADQLMRQRGHRWTASGQRHQVQLGERLLIFERC